MPRDAQDPLWTARLEDLHAAANQLNIEVECRDLGDPEFPARSGLCRIQNRRILLIDARLAPEDQANIILDVLRDHDLAAVYVAPWIRDRLENEPF